MSHGFGVVQVKTWGCLYARGLSFLHDWIWKSDLRQWVRCIFRRLSSTWVLINLNLVYRWDASDQMCFWGVIQFLLIRWQRWFCPTGWERMHMQNVRCINVWTTLNSQTSWNSIDQIWSVLIPIWGQGQVCHDVQKICCNHSLTHAFRLWCIPSFHRVSRGRRGAWHRQGDLLCKICLQYMPTCT